MCCARHSPLTRGATDGEDISAELAEEPLLGWLVPVLVQRAMTGQVEDAWDRLERRVCALRPTHTHSHTHPHTYTHITTAPTLITESTADAHHMPLAP